MIGYMTIEEQVNADFDRARRHTSNIYGKLGVRNRAEALAGARGMELLQ